MNPFSILGMLLKDEMLFIFIGTLIYQLYYAYSLHGATPCKERWKRLDLATVATFNTQNVATLGRLK